MSILDHRMRPLTIPPHCHIPRAAEIASGVLPCQGKSLPGFVLGVRLSRGRNNREGTSKLLFLLLLGLFLLSFHRLQRSIPIPIRRILRKVDLALEEEEESKFSMRKKDGSGSVGLLSIGPQKAVKCNLV